MKQKWIHCGCNLSPHKECFVAWCPLLPGSSRDRTIDDSEPSQDPKAKADGVELESQLLDGQTGPIEIFVLGASCRRFETGEIASTLVKDGVWRCSLVLEVDQGRVGATDGSHSEWRLAILCTGNTREIKKEKVVAVAVSEDVLWFLLGGGLNKLGKVNQWSVHQLP